MKYTLTFRSQIEALKGIIVITFSFMAISVLFRYALDSFFPSSIILLIIYLLFYFIPVIILHINYIKYARGRVLIVGSDFITYDNQTYSIDEIVSIEVFSTSQHKKNGSGARTLAHNEYYYFIQINFRNEEKIIINSLLGQNIDRYLISKFPDLAVKYHLHFFRRLLITK
ncbi:hypothetical protein EA772_01240 [Pedobacter sp. G11]|uniref:hypothetical protein n=1 Tax=Pedobacter sp. G11 TaxID=2482728 RepID=UPI000F5F4000|nr:hypothetical protein [Pedobacter sp. G11]AZI24033.1 hypothetical protein EA772_01240 [Pedobacter sp. G11]